MSNKQQPRPTPTPQEIIDRIVFMYPPSHHAGNLTQMFIGWLMQMERPQQDKEAMFCTYQVLTDALNDIRALYPAED